MHLLTIEAISKQFGETPLFTGVSFGLDAGERAGIIGVNGSGKSTLLRIVAGVETPDGGRVVARGDAHIAYLPQNPEMRPDQTVLDYLFGSDDPRMALIREYQAVVDALARAPADPGLLGRMNDLAERIEVAGAWDVEREAREILTRVGITDTTQRLGTLSGGQRRRVALAATLLQAADLLILDEPTNHIDADTIAWLETLLARRPVAVLLVTHDRYFLDRLVTRTIEIDRSGVHQYEGGYEAYLAATAQRAETERADAARYVSIMRKELAWLGRGARGRGTKQKARIERIGELQAGTPRGDDDELAFTVKSAQRLGKRVLDVEHAARSFDGRRVFEDVSLSLVRGDRLGIVGPNGSGKTTLLNLLAGRLEPDVGAVRRGETVHLAYYDQESAGLNERMRVIDYLKEAAELVQTVEGALVTASALLERFLFPSNVQWKQIASLSGGERRRLYLLRTLLFGPNVLLLDEPTNDLDLQTLAILEDYLDGFDGTLIVASHDRYFLDRTVNQILAMEPGGTATSYAGDYTAYAEERRRREAATKVEPSKKAAPLSPRPASTRPRTLTFREQRELAAIEERIMQLEDEQKQLNAALAAGAGGYAELHRDAERLAGIAVELEAAVERWAELSSIAEAAQGSR